MTPIIRIILRIAAGVLIGRGMPAEIGEVFTSPDMELAVGAAVLAVSEGWYVLAKRFGWRT